MCYHMHGQDELTPQKMKHGGWYHPSQGEVEYTADLALGIAVAFSWWAVRADGAKLAMPWAPRALQAGTEGFDGHATSIRRHINGYFTVTIVHEGQGWATSQALFSTKFRASAKGTIHARRQHAQGKTFIVQQPLQK